MNTDMHYLQLLSQSFPNIAEASTEIINLEAIMNLPKGTEHFLADLHGESEAFQHVLKNASGNIKRKVNELLATTSVSRRRKSSARSSTTQSRSWNSSRRRSRISTTGTASPSTSW